MLWATLVLMMAITAAVSAAPAPQPDAQLLFAIETDKPNYVLYEPVYLVSSVENITSLGIDTGLHLDVSCGDFVLFITGPDGNTRTYDSFIDINAARIPIRLEPGECREYQNTLYWDMNGFVFPVPGEYEISTALPEPWNSRYQLHSQKARIRVHEPMGVDCEAIEFFSSDADFLLLLKWGARAYCKKKDAIRCREELEIFVDWYPESAYAPLVLQHLESLQR